MTPIGGTDRVGEQAVAIADAARAVPGVAGLTGGAFGTVATYLAGQRVVGVSLSEDSGQVAIIGSIGFDLAAVGEQVRSAAEKICGLPIEVLVADLDTGDDSTSDGSAVNEKSAADEK